MKKMAEICSMELYIPATSTLNSLRFTVPYFVSQQVRELLSECKPWVQTRKYFLNFVQNQSRLDSGIRLESRQD